ncbi:antibiotic biosynthesis monooxygenase [bacterium]|nr:antibiotic biosynthesis monooxygenase [bacterium]MBU1958523.1 antibiotic biosynthesis monooxygenase [bacterium]
MSKKLYCIASFEPKEGKFEALFTTLRALEPNSLREDGCLQYIVTHHIQNPFAEGESYPIVFNEIWESVEAFEEHCQREEISTFFERHCVDKEGLVAKYNVAVYTDEMKGI